MGSSIVKMLSSKHFLILTALFIKVNSQCNAGIYMMKTHSWNKGYVAKLYLDQSWLNMATSEWKLNLLFNDEVAEFKVWDAEILNPSTSTNYVSNATAVEIMNKCWNPIAHSCQYLDLNFLVRFDETVVSTTNYDLISVVENASYSDGTTGSVTYCAPISDEPPATAGSTTTS